MAEAAPNDDLSTLQISAVAAQTLQFTSSHSRVGSDVVSANLKANRLRAGLSQSQLAERVGKSVRYISALENQAQNVTLETLEVLAAGLGVSVPELTSQGADVVPRQVRKAREDFDKAIELLNSYRTWS